MNDRLTAMDVERQEFPARMLGYDKEDVRLFLRSVGEEIERLNFENGTLREEVGRLRETLKELRSRERMLQETLIAAQSLANMASFESESAGKSAAMAAIVMVAEQLGNTVAICRKCYIHPAVLEAFTSESTWRLWSKQSVEPTVEDGLGPEENALLRFLSAWPE